MSEYGVHSKGKKHLAKFFAAAVFGVRAHFLGVGAGKALIDETWQIKRKPPAN